MLRPTPCLSKPDLPARAAEYGMARDRLPALAGLVAYVLPSLRPPLIQFRIFSDMSQESRPFGQIEKVFRDECARALQEMANVALRTSSPKNLMSTVSSVHAC